jgi:translocation and assembly module TamA
LQNPNIKEAGYLLVFLLFLLSRHDAYGQSIDISYAIEPPANIKATIKEALPEVTALDSALHARRQARRAKAVVEKNLNSYGYYKPEIAIKIIDVDNRPRPSLTVKTGPLFKLDRVLMDYAGVPPKPNDMMIVESALSVKPGLAAIPIDIIDGERVISTELRRLGYAFAIIKSRDVIGDLEAATISVRYNIESGDKVKIGQTLYPDNIATKANYLSRINPLERGQTYAPETLAQFNSRLSDTRLFSKSQARLSDVPSDQTESGDVIYDVILDLVERPRNTVAAGASYGTNEGFGVTAELTRRNLTRRGDLLAAALQLAEREISLDTQWRSPNELGYGKGLVINARLLDEETDSFDQQLARLGVGYEAVVNSRFNYNFGVSGQYISQTETGIEQDFQTLSGSAGLNLDYSDSLLDPSVGWRLSGELAPSYAFSDQGDRSYVRALAHGRVYRPLTRDNRVVIAARLRAGALLGADAADIPSEERFYAGGGGSVRGYSYQAVGPRDINDIATGGSFLLDGSVEARWRYNSKIGVVAFVDAGDVSTQAYPTFNTLEFGVGMGARYQTPAGPIRFDIAIPLDASETDGPFQIYLSIGQAF